MDNSQELLWIKALYNSKDGSRQQANGLSFFSKELSEGYYPLDKVEDEKCVSLVNGTNSDRSNFRSLHGRKVVATGLAVRYDDLQNGTSDFDRLLSRKYYEGEPVHNFCLRDFVFVVRTLSAS